MPDTAQDWLDRHAAIWGVARGQPVPAKFNLTLTGADTTVVPAGATLTSAANVVFTADAAVTLSGGATLAVTASVAGSAGNLTVGAVLKFASPIGGLAPQSGTVAAITQAGADIEDAETWRARILARIRNPPMGGAAADYVAWVQQVVPGAYVSVQANWVGNGTVGVIVAMPGSPPTAPSGGELTTLANWLAPLRPVTAQVSVLAATPTAVAVTLHLSPDTTATRASATAALALFFQQDAAIGGTVFMSRLDDAVSSASGEYSHERSLPTADVTMTATQIPVLGTVTFT